MKDSDIESAVRKLRVRLLAAIAINTAVLMLAGWLFVWGTLTLILRMAVHADLYLLFSIGSVGIVISILISIIVARSKIPQETLLRAKLDSLNHGGGIMIAASENDVHEWNDRLSISLVPSAKWHNRRASILLAAAALFAIAAFIVPEPQLQTDAGAMAAGEIVKELQDKLDVLEEEKLIDEERAQTIEENLENITDSADADDPIKTWEALDNVSDSISGISETAAQNLLKTAEDAALMRELAENLRDSIESGNIGADVSTEAMRELAAMMNAKNMMNAMQNSISSELAAELAKKMANASLSPEDLKKLEQALKKCGNCSSAKMAKLCKANLADPSKLAACKCASANAEDALLAFLSSEGKDSEALSLCVASSCPKPGTGAPTRGRGDAPMTWTDGTDENGVDFKDETIPPDSIADLDKSRVVGLSKTAPSQKTHSVKVKGGLLNTTVSSSGGAWHQQVQPQHKKTVSRYFYRGATTDD